MKSTFKKRKLNKVLKEQTLYSDTVCTIENIQKGLLHVRTILENDSSVMYVQVLIHSNAPYYSTYAVSVKVFISRDKEDVTPILNDITIALENFKIKYALHDNISFSIKGNIYYSHQDFSILKKEAIRKKVVTQLNTIQKQIFRAGSPSFTQKLDVKDILITLNDISSTVSKDFIMTSSLYLHIYIYTLKDSSITIKPVSGKEYLTSWNFQDTNTSSLIYIRSTLVKITKDGQTIQWVDHHFQNNILHRIYQENVYIIKDKVITDIHFHYQFPSLRKDYTTEHFSHKIGVIDIETCLTDANIIVPYAAGYKIHGDKKLFYGLDCVTQLINYIQHHYSDYIFYTHNLDFDGIYLLQALIATTKDPEKIQVILKEGESIVSIKIDNLQIFDSLKILPISLNNLAKDFQLTRTKIILPYNFIRDNILNYIGKKPNIEFYTKINQQQYNQLPDIFNVKKDTLQYLDNDLEILYAIIVKFQTIIYDQFQIDITIVKTIPGLAYRLYIKRYYQPSYNVKAIKGIPANDIGQSHYGGISNVYQQTIQNGYYYDINSQYPNAILKSIPTGNPTFITNPTTDKIFGFYYAIIQPIGGNNTILPSRNAKGIVTYPNEEFQGWYFSEELKEIIKLGWTIQVKFGYQFTSSTDIFKTYVQDLYNKRLQYKQQNNNAVATVLKFLLNSLYGRIAFQTPITRTKVIPINKLQNFQYKYLVEKVVYVTKKYILVYYNEKAEIQTITQILTTSENIESTLTTEIKENNYLNVSLPLASAIASYARISMLPFKTNPLNPPFYTDTDSIVVQQPLPSNYVSNTELGKMKEPLHIKSAVFLAPKVYILQLNDGTVIIKAAGIDSSQLSIDSFQQLANQQQVPIQGYRISIDPQTFEKKYELYSMNLYFPK